jgi:putative membrane protein
VGALSDSDRERVRATIASIEDRTDGEIVPLVVERSDPHTHTLMYGAVLFALIANLALLKYLPPASYPRLVQFEFVLLMLGLGFAYLCPDYRRWFLTRRRSDAATSEQALAELARLMQGKQQPPALVLLFVSLFEHRVIVLASEPVAGALGAEHWPAVVEAVLGGVRRGKLADGLVAGLNECAADMQRAFPAGPSRENHFADRAITRRE